MTEANSIWTELSLRVLPAAAEPVAELLQAITGAGVAIEPPIKALGPDEGYLLDEAAPLTLRAYLYGPVASARRDGIRRRLRRAGLTDSVVGPLAWGTIREEDWAEAWKAHYDIERVGRVVVRPAWREYEAAAGEVVVSLDPGMAFGTGQHPTTRMALTALPERLRPGDRVLDLGCGSGILALAAIGLGASTAVAVDTEEQAVKASVANVALNASGDSVSVRHGSIDTATDAAPYDFILANINAATVIALAPDMRAALVQGREVVAGGIIQERETEVLKALEAAGFAIERVLADGDWRSVIATAV